MTFQIRLVAIEDNGQEQVHELTSVQRGELKLKTLGLSLAESKAIFRDIQRVMVEQQSADWMAAHKRCPACGQTSYQGASRSSNAHGLRQNYACKPALAAL